VNVNVSKKIISSIRRVKMSIYMWACFAERITCMKKGELVGGGPSDPHEG
jgi:hypothetical protein